MNDEKMMDPIEREPSRSREYSKPKGPQVIHLNDKRANRKAICRKFGITMKYLRKQIKLAKREGMDISHWGC